MKRNLFALVLINFFFINISNSQIPNIENREKKKIKTNILNTYYRSMNKWDISFQDLLENKSGAACIEWPLMTESFLSSGIFDALGYSQNIPNKKASEIAAVSGCNKMKDYYQLEGKCECQVIVVNDNNKVILPIKKIDIEESFSEGINFFKDADYVNALKVFDKLSNVGHAKSQFNLSLMNLKGLGVTQNYSRSYFWALASKLYGEKKSILILRQSQYKISKEEKNTLEIELKEYLENLSKKGSIHAFLPLAKWYISVQKKPDYNNSYKWLSIATAFNLENAKKARDKVSNYVKEDALISIQEEAKETFEEIKSNIKLKKKLDGE